MIDRPTIARRFSFALLLLPCVAALACTNKSPTHPSASALATAADSLSCGPIVDLLRRPAAQFNEEAKHVKAGGQTEISGLRALARSGAFNRHAEDDPIATLQVFNPPQPPGNSERDLVFLVDESGKATFQGCLARPDTANAEVDLPVTDRDPGVGAVLLLDPVSTFGKPFNDGALMQSRPIYHGGTKSLRFFATTTGVDAPMIADPYIEDDGQITLDGREDLTCRPACLPLRVWVFDARPDGDDRLIVRQVATRQFDLSRERSQRFTPPPQPSGTLRIVLDVGGLNQNVYALQTMLYR